MWILRGGEQPVERPWRGTPLDRRGRSEPRRDRAGRGRSAGRVGPGRRFAETRATSTYPLSTCLTAPKAVASAQGVLTDSAGDRPLLTGQWAAALASRQASEASGVSNTEGFFADPPRLSRRGELRGGEIAPHGPRDGPSGCKNLAPKSVNAATTTGVRRSVRASRGSAPEAIQGKRCPVGRECWSLSSRRSSSVVWADRPVFHWRGTGLEASAAVPGSSVVRHHPVLLRVPESIRTGTSAKASPPACHHSAPPM